MLLFKILFSQMWSRRDFPKHPLRDVILKSAWDKIHSEVLKRCYESVHDIVDFQSKFLNEYQY